MPDDAVMDAAVDTDVSTPDTGDTGADPSEPQDQIAEPSQVGEPGKAITDPAKPLVDGGKLSADAKKHLEELKVSNPQLARGIQRALYKEAEWQKEVPGGIAEVRELRQTVETLGGPNGIQEIQAEVNGWHQFDEQYTAGDPKAVEFMTSDPVGQEAFLKLIPSAIQKYEQLHPEGYRNYMAQVFNATAAQSDVPLTLMRLADLVADNPRAMEQLQRLDGFFKFIKGEALKQVEAPKFQKEDGEGRERSDFEKERTAFERGVWKSETAVEQRQLFESEWTRLSAGRKLTGAQEAAVRELFELRLDRAVNGPLDPQTREYTGKHHVTLQRYFGAKDKTGFLRYASQISKTEVPKALREAFDAVVPSRPGPKASTATPARNGGPPAKGVPIVAGFTQVAEQPASNEIDYRNPFNTRVNFQAGRAVLVGGKKVSWQKKT